MKSYGKKCPCTSLVSMTFRRMVLVVVFAVMVSEMLIRTRMRNCFLVIVYILIVILVYNAAKVRKLSEICKL